MNKGVVFAVALVLLIVAGLLMWPRFAPTHAPEAEVVTEDSTNLQLQEDTTNMKTPPAMQIDASKTYTATLKTTQGEIVIELDTINTPITSNNFIVLAKDNFYTDTIFHRVIDGFMIQGGDPEGNGTGGPGYSIPDEIQQENKNEVGTISMANAGPNTGGSQFFINLVNNSFLDDKHPVFGTVIEGMDVVELIGKVSTDMNDMPVEPVKITSIEITEK